MLHTVQDEPSKPSKKRRIDTKPAAAAAPTAEEETGVPGTAQPEGRAADRAVDIRAWEGYGLGPKVLEAISGLGFEEPTSIQRECLLPAVRDRRDVIGAAQTVRDAFHGPCHLCAQMLGFQSLCIHVAHVSLTG
jgi:ATP-dependent RNA helicase DDX24/MAK5